MRSKYSVDEFLLAVAKKKPRLQALVDGVAQMTEADIDALSEALWVRQALKILKLSGGKGQLERLQDIVRQADEADAKLAALPKRTYEVRLWDCDPDFVGTDPGYQNGWKIQVEAGDSFMIFEDNQVRFGDSVLTVDEFNMTPLMMKSKLIGYMTLDNYRGFHRALLNQRHKNL